jgi:hypothetical protein
MGLFVQTRCSTFVLVLLEIVFCVYLFGLGNPYSIKVLSKDFSFL